MPAWKRTTKKGKFKELARKKAFQKKGEPKRNFLHTLLNQKSMKIARWPKKREKLKVFKKVLK